MDKRALPFRLAAMPVPADAVLTPQVPDLAREYPSKGKVLSHKHGQVIFAPSETTYECHLGYDFDGGSYTLPERRPVRGIIAVKARKIYTVPSGGNFIEPIIGEPRRIQGRVRAATGTHLLLHAGASVLVELPKTPDAIDLHSGEVTIGQMVNVVAYPGATYLPITPAPAAPDENAAGT